jgi:hypothetical protein
MTRRNVSNGPLHLIVAHSSIKNFTKNEIGKYTDTEQILAARDV